MGEAQASIGIDRGADEVWTVVGDFAGIGWMAGIDSVTVDGDDRTLQTMGLEIVEHLISRDDEARAITYGIVGGSLPVESHEATITVVPAGESCTVTWDVAVEPDGLTAIMEQTYQGALKALKERLEAE